jgi:hypothetical protein
MGAIQALRKENLHDGYHEGAVRPLFTGSTNSRV